MSERKAFNFYKSFYDVYTEIDNDKDRLAFIDALLKRQFTGKIPTDLKGQARFAYKSQEQIINQQIEGWENKTKTTLAKGGTQGGQNTPSVQEKGKEKEQVEYTNTESIDFGKLLTFINKTLNRQFKTINKTVQAKYKARLQDGYRKDDILKAVTNASKDPFFQKDGNAKHLTPEYFSRANTLDKYGQDTEIIPEGMSKEEWENHKKMIHAHK